MSKQDSLLMVEILLTFKVYLMHYILTLRSGMLRGKKAPLKAIPLSTNNKCASAYNYNYSVMLM